MWFQFKSIYNCFVKVNLKIIIEGNGDTCPTTVSVANIITQNILNGTAKTENISVNSKISDDGRLISIIEITITKINS